MAARTFRVGAVLELRDRLSKQMLAAGRAVRRASGDVEKGGRIFDRVGNSVQGFARRVETAFSARSKRLIHNWFMGLKISSAIGTAALTAGFVKGIQKAADFEQAIRQTTALIAGDADLNAAPGSGMSPEDASRRAQAAFEEFSSEILQMAPRLGKSPIEVANALNAVVSAGFEGSDALNILEVATKAAAAGNADAANVTQVLVQTLQAYALSAEDAMNISDLMFQAVNKGIIEFDEMAGSLGNVVGMAATAKVPFEQLMAAIEVMTLRGLGPEEAITSLNQFMVSIIDTTGPAQEALVKLFGSGEKVKELFSAQALAKGGIVGVADALVERLGITPEQLKALERAGESEEAIRAIIGGETIDQLTGIFPNIRALRGALLLTATDGVTLTQAMEDMGFAAGATERAFEEQSKTVNFAKAQMKSYFDVLKINVFSSLLPGLSNSFKRIGEWIRIHLLENPIIADPEASFGAKVKEIGRVLWTALTDWWEENKATVNQKLGEGAEWIGNTLIPKVVDAGFEVGKMLAPALWDGFKEAFFALLETPAGAAAIAAVLGVKLAAVWGGAGGTMGGTVPGGTVPGKGGTPAGGTTLLGGHSIALTAATVTIAGVSAWKLGETIATEWQRTGKAQKDFETKVEGATVKELQAVSDMDMNNWATGALSILPGRKQPREIFEEELAKKEKSIVKGFIESFANTGIGDSFLNEAKRRLTAEGIKFDPNMHLGNLNNMATEDSAVREVVMGMLPWASQLVGTLRATRDNLGNADLTNEEMARLFTYIDGSLGEVDNAAAIWKTDMTGLHTRLSEFASSWGVDLPLGPYKAVTPQDLAPRRVDRPGDSAGANDPTPRPRLVSEPGGVTIQGNLIGQATIKTEEDAKAVADALAAELAALVPSWAGN